MADRMLLFTLLLYVAVLCIIVRVIKYLIRYGIDYYFKKLDEYKQKSGGKRNETGS